MNRPRIVPEGDERWIYIARRHWIALVLRSLIPGLVGLLAIAILCWRVLGRAPDFLGRLPPVLDGLNLMLMVAGILMVAILIYTYIDWNNDHLIISNKRLILEDQSLLLAF